MLFSGLLKGKDAAIDKDLNDMAKKETVADQMFHKFKKKIQFEPEQVLRYQHKGTGSYQISLERLEIITDPSIHFWLHYRGSQSTTSV